MAGSAEAPHGLGGQAAPGIRHDAKRPKGLGPEGLDVEELQPEGRNAGEDGDLVRAECADDPVRHRRRLDDQGRAGPDAAEQLVEPVIEAEGSRLAIRSLS